MQSLLLLLLGWMVLHPTCFACPFFTLNGTIQTNYTNFTLAINTACNTTFDLWICDGGVLNSTDTVPFVMNNCFLKVHGKTDINGTGAYFNTSAASGAFSATLPIFAISGSSRVSFDNLQILFSNTLFTVTQSAQLNLTRVTAFFGKQAVVVSPLSTNTYPFIGTAFSVDFGSIGIVFNPISSTTLLTCQFCYFSGLTTAGILLTAGSLAQMNTNYVTFTNTLVPFGRAAQKTYNGGLSVTTIVIPQSFALAHNIIVAITNNCVQVTPTKSYSPTPVFGVAPVKKASSGSSSGTNSATFITALVILVILAILLLVALMRTIGSAKLNKSAMQLLQDNSTI
jgi:hypothetical protein